MQSAKSNASTVDKGLAIIDRQLNQMVRLVDDLLDVSRITTGKLTLRLEPADLRAVAQNALEAIEPIFTARNHQVQTELPPTGTMIEVDPTRLSQVFLNLLNNAAKFTDPGGRIDFTVRIEGDEMVATVRDSGIGIAPEMVDELFEMFAQADRSLERPTAGLGVGLSLARRLVELHGGTLTVRSAGLGHGSEFTVRIPVRVQSAGIAEMVPRYEDHDAATAQRILLVDDNIDFANSLALLLRELGHEVHTEHDGAAALAAVVQFKPDVAFLDIGLPKLNGYDLARRLRNLPETAGILLVAVTGWGQPADHRLAVEAGFDEYLVKPVSLQDVKTLLYGATIP
jgi:CheY-like chemotaxis protein